jgi:outer membrane protein
MKQSLKILLVGLGLSTCLFANAEEGSWVVRARATQLNWHNGQADGLAAYNIKAENKTIPEIDISYFFTPNVAAELVLTYPQKVNLKLAGANIGSAKALPPSLLLQYHCTKYGAFKPYVGAGLNYTRFSDRGNILGGAASIDKSSVGLVGQVGFDYAIDKNWSFNVDLKYIQIDTDVAVSGTKIGKLNLNPIAPSIGIGYRF